MKFMMLWEYPVQMSINNAQIATGNFYLKNGKNKLLKRLKSMRRRIIYRGLKKALSNERQARLNQAWAYLSPWQRVVIYTKIQWYSLPSLYQIIEHVKFFYLRWLTYRVYAAHWVNHAEKK